MDEIVQQVAQRAGIPEDRAPDGGSGVMDQMEKRLPAPLAAQLRSHLTGQAAGGAGALGEIATARRNVRQAGFWRVEVCGRFAARLDLTRKKSSALSRIHGFPPIASAGARLLVLGTMPGRASLRARQYYAHPRNAFWRIAGELFGFSFTAPYSKRVESLISRDVAVWDVLQLCTRESSLDSDIDEASIVPNDFSSFFSTQPKIRLIGLNGTTAARLFDRHVAPSLRDEHAAIPRVLLPSTSPAHARLSVEGKSRIWRDALGEMARPDG
jgi:double-stranded uracil-DNA glycosylase